MEKEVNDFTKTVETDAIAMRDEFFVRLTKESLDIISKRQHDMEQKDFCKKWSPFIGEKVLLYDANDNGDLSFVGESSIPYIEDDMYDDLDLRLAEKMSLTRTAAYKLAKYLYQGEGNLDDIGFHCSVVLMLFVRNGFDKNDFKEQFCKDLIDALGELIDGKSSFTVGEPLSLSLYEYGKGGYITDIRKESLRMAKKFPPKAFHVYDDKLIQAIKDNVEDYPKAWPNKECLGQYVVVEDTESEEDKVLYMTFDKLAKHKGELFVSDMSLETYSAMIDFCDQFFLNDCETSMLLDNFSRCIALYMKNGRTPEDFWKDFCVELYNDAKKNSKKEAAQ